MVSQKFGQVVILNGPSCVGKSSIQKEFQYLMMPHLWTKLGIDILFDKPMPDITSNNMHLWATPNSIRWVEISKDQNNNNIIDLHRGIEGEKVAYGMNSAIAAYTQNGCSVIVDYIAYEKEWIHDLRYKLKDFSTLWVKVTLPLDILEKRETESATSPKGHARSHYYKVFWDVKYDLEISTDTESSIECAQKIKSFLDYYR